MFLYFRCQKIYDFQFAIGDYDLQNEFNIGLIFKPIKASQLIKIF